MSANTFTAEKVSGPLWLELDTGMKGSLVPTAAGGQGVRGCRCRKIVEASETVSGV